MRRSDRSGPTHGGLCLSRNRFIWGLVLILGWNGTAWGAGSPSGLVGTAKWEPEIRAFEAFDRTNPPPGKAILFVGSSSIRLWKTLAQDFPGCPVINRGFGGSQLVDCIYFADRIITPYRPGMVVVYGGANDLNAGKTPEQVFGDFCGLVAKIRAADPRVPIVFISIAGNPARWEQVDRVRAANRRIQQYCAAHEGMRFVDVFSRMLGPDGLPREEIFVGDRLHMNEKGYAIWRELIRPHLALPPGGGTD